MTNQRAIPGRKRALAEKLRNHYAMHMKMRRQENSNAKPGRYTRPKGEVGKFWTRGELSALVDEHLLNGL